jgi:hypothetical protein
MPNFKVKIDELDPVETLLSTDTVLVDQPTVMNGATLTPGVTRKASMTKIQEFIGNGFTCNTGTSDIIDDTTKFTKNSSFTYPNFFSSVVKKINGIFTGISNLTTTIDTKVSELTTLINTKASSSSVALSRPGNSGDTSGVREIFNSALAPYSFRTWIVTIGGNGGAVGTWQGSYIVSAICANDQSSGSANFNVLSGLADNVGKFSYSWNATNKRISIRYNFDGTYNRLSVFGCSLD